MIDHHVHTAFSTDAPKEATMRAYIEQAKRLHLNTLMFTDHVDLCTPKGIAESCPDYDQVKATLRTLRKTEDMTLLLGVEFGYHADALSRYQTILNQVAFDFVIMSVHSVQDLDLYHGELFETRSQEAAYEAYFNTVLELVQTTQNYDVVGHLDYIIRYGDFPTKDYDFERFKPIIDQILTTIIKHNKGIELNTSGLRYGLKHMHPKLDVLKRYKALGGTIITLGSDAHHPKALQADFTEAVKLLKKAGFTHITTFKNRQPTQQKI